MRKNNNIAFLFMVGFLIFGCNSKPTSTDAASETKTEQLAESDSVFQKKQAKPPVDHESESPASQSETHFEEQLVDKKMIEKYPLLPHLEEQKSILKANSKKSDERFEPDGKYSFGKFDSGIVELTIEEISGEPAYIFGKTDDMKGEVQLEFLVYKIPMEKLDRTPLGKKYKVHWIETICFMEPFEPGYQRCYVAYKIE